MAKKWDDASIRVMLWGKEMGRVGYNLINGYVFAYSPEWIASGINPSPLMMKLKKGGYKFLNLNPQTYYGLPGLIADALPDRFGNAVIDAYMLSKGLMPESITALQRLAYIGRRGMGALEFEPSDGPDGQESVFQEPLVMREMVESARRLISGEVEDALGPLVEIGSSAGGARAKAVVGYNAVTRSIISGQFDLPPGYKHYLIKLDGVEGKSGIYGRREMAYLDMAAAAGITVPEHFLLEENGHAHLMIRRFDRADDGQKIHMQTLCGLAHLDYNQRMTTDYSAWLRIIRGLNLGQPAIDEAFRRMVFAVAGVNCDDHTKNQSFLMDKKGVWSLSPAYDLAYAWNPSPDHWTHRHQMLINGNAWAITRGDLLAVGAAVDIKAKDANNLIDHVLWAVGQWLDFAGKAGLNEQNAMMILDRQKEAMTLL